MRTSRLALAMVIMAAGVAGDWCIDRAYARAVLRSAAARQEFKEFPASIGRRQAVAVALTNRELALLAVDDYLRADFVAPGEPSAISVYAGYYKNPDRATQHPPTICYPGSGWLKTYEGSRTLTPRGAQQIQVRETTFESGQRKTLVVYWYSMAGYTGAEASWHKIIRVARLLSGRGMTGMLKVQISLAIDTSREEAEARLNEFLADFLPVLAAYSPGDIEGEK